MRAELLAACLALLLAAIQLASVELRIRAARREREHLEHRVTDVQRAVGAARRADDPGGQRGVLHREGER